MPGSVFDAEVLAHMFGDHTEDEPEGAYPLWKDGSPIASCSEVPPGPTRKTKPALRTRDSQPLALDYCPRSSAVRRVPMLPQAQ